MGVGASIARRRSTATSAASTTSVRSSASFRGTRGRGRATTASCAPRSSSASRAKRGPMTPDGEIDRGALPARRRGPAELDQLPRLLAHVQPRGRDRRREHVHARRRPLRHGLPPRSEATRSRASPTTASVATRTSSLPTRIEAAREATSASTRPTASSSTASSRATRSASGSSSCCASSRSAPACRAGSSSRDLVDPRYFGKANIENRVQSYLQMLEAREAAPRGQAAAMKVRRRHRSRLDHHQGRPARRATAQSLGRGITNSRSNYEVACAVARDEALHAARFTLLERALERARVEGARLAGARARRSASSSTSSELGELRDDDRARVSRSLTYARRPRGARARGRARCSTAMRARRAPRCSSAARRARATSSATSPARALHGGGRERVARGGDGRRSSRWSALFDRAILDVETRLAARHARLLRRALAGRATPARERSRASSSARVDAATRSASRRSSFVGTGYGRQTLPFPKEAVRSEILCHGRGAHRVFPGTRTVLDIGGQDTKAIQVDDHGVVTLVPDERSLRRRLRALPRLHRRRAEPRAPRARSARAPARSASSRSTRRAPCSPGAELRERLALGAASRGHPRRAAPRDHAARDVAPRALAAA